MNRGQSAVVGAIVLAGALFRVVTDSTPKVSASLKSPPAHGAGSKTTSGEGPWLASCRYWTAARWKAPARKEKAPEPATGSEAGPQADSLADDPTTDCEAAGDRWGIPKTSNDANGASPSPAEDVHKLEIRAIIAAVPDPVHSHLTLEFDRTIDSLMQAAADNRYLGSNYWLPWRAPHSSSASTENSAMAMQTEDDRDREQQPGLIILKYSPQIDEKDFAWSSYHRVIYLFLVGESPAIGMNSVQLRNALRYEAMLLSDYNAKLSMSDDASQLAVIGPGSSGSAASLREGIVNATFDKGGVGSKVQGITHVIAAGTTSTPIASQELNSSSATRSMTYYSFGEDTRFEEDRLLEVFKGSHPDARHTAILSEDNTVFGEMNSQRTGSYGPIYIRFPREISLLRNAQGEQTGKSSGLTESPTPYLNLSLKDLSADDTVPQFSIIQTPLSQEAQLMAIAHQLQRARVEYILITASNILDELFLAQFLHRACPDARIVFYNGGDLLVERDLDNVRYIGSITVSPYDLTTLGRPLGAWRAFSDSQAEAIYNAASYIFWQGSPESGKEPPKLSGYLRGEGKNLQAPLWATAVGSDGYYPLGLLSGCASQSVHILPTIDAAGPKKCADIAISSMQLLARPSPNAAPSLFWTILCVLIAGLCVGHGAVMLSAEYWSPFTRDLAVHQNDQPRRRAVYLNIGTAVLFCMAFAIASPMFLVLRVYRWDLGNLVVACITLLFGIAAVVATIFKTWPYLGYQPQKSPKYPTDLYFIFNLIALATVIMFPVIWVWICVHDPAKGAASHVGLFFSYRCLHPSSGVSPVIPVLLLLSGWYLWSAFQTARLRFSTMNRPRLPDHVSATSAYPLFVSDNQLGVCRNSIHSCMFENISCLLITREVLRRFTRWSHNKLNTIFFLVYMSLFALCVFCGRIQSLERFLLDPGRRPTAYEFLIAALFFPLIMVVLTGWLRMILIWGSLSRGLLEPLERMPIRSAFTRLKEVGWMTMLSQSSLHIRWRDMARSNESVRQLINNDELRKAISDEAKWDAMKEAYDDLTLKLKELREHIRLQKRSKNVRVAAMEHPKDDFDLPIEKDRRDLSFIYSIEKRYAAFCELILSDVLIPYWNAERIGFVEDDADVTDKEHAKPDSDAPKDPLYIRLAEELIVIRYVSLIRSVLVNIRFLMLFVSSAFVLAIIAWNSYPFQPHQLIDWCFTLLLIFLGIGFVWLLAQMHRNAILSRITDTIPNELGLDFYLRIVTFGAVPVLTWFAYQFPGLGGSLFRILQPGLQVIK